MAVSMSMIDRGALMVVRWKIYCSYSYPYQEYVEAVDGSNHRRQTAVIASIEGLCQIQVVE